MSDKMREGFDAWCMERNIQRLDCLMEGQVQHQSVLLAWQAWQASRAAMVVDLPDAMGYPLAYHEAISDVEAALDDAGVSYK